MDANQSVRDEWLAHAKQVDGRLARILVSWWAIAATKPAEPRNPDDPSYRFAVIDSSVESALAAGLQPVLLIDRAPAWAEGANRDPKAAMGTWKPNADDAADFVVAVAKRYPEVKYIQLWNEPNLTGNLMPQWKGKRNVAAPHYREMVNASDAALDSLGSPDRLLTAGLAPYGDDPGGRRTRPLMFWRQFFCLNQQLKRSCRSKAHFDTLALHAFNTSGSPMASAYDRDDMNPVDMPKARTILRAAERQGTAPGRHAIWVTESWWETNPPEKGKFTLKQQARYIPETMYLSWKAGASAMIYLRIKDSGEAIHGDSGSEGIYFVDGTPKPSVSAFAFPFVAEPKQKGGKRGNGRKQARRVVLWGKAPTTGKVTIEELEKGRWQTIAHADAGSTRIFKSHAKLEGKPKLRARIGSEISPVWKLK